ncbi:O-antigen ligase family protein [Streptomyces sp. NPDC050658]|uniref:O-antigen ligase family protein n=1 Tax=unclassified Streptomyces TaxID=2593676 RepID=UPI00341F02C5
MNRVTAAVGWGALLVAGSALACFLLAREQAPEWAPVAVCSLLLVGLRPQLPLLALLCALPLVAAAGFGGMAVFAVVIAAVTLVGFHAAVKGFRPGIDVALIVLLAVVLLVSCVLPRMAGAAATDGAWNDLRYLLAGLAVLAACLVAAPDPRRVAQLTACCGSGTAAYLLMCGDHAQGRLFGLGLNPNYVGVLLALATVAAVGIAKASRNWMWLLPALVCAAAVFETRSRGAFLAVLAGLACLFLAGRPARQKVLLVFAGLVAVLVLPGTLNSQNGLTGDRSSTELAANSEVRTQAALLAARVAFENPLRGIGYARFPDFAASAADLHVSINTHNDYLRLAAEAGALALVLFVALMWRGLARRCSGYEAVLRAVVVAYAGALVFANTLSNLVVTIAFWMALGCLLARTSDSGSPAPPASGRRRPRPPTRTKKNHPRGARCHTDQRAACLS